METQESNNVNQPNFINSVIVERNKTIYELEKPKNDCTKILFDMHENVKMNELLMDCFRRGVNFDFSISEIMGNGVCKINKLKLAYRLYLLEDGGDVKEETSETISDESVERSERGRFYIDRIMLSRRRTIMFLNTSKSGFNQLVFDYGDEPELKSILLNHFETGRSFDFRISQSMGGGQCKIDMVMRVY
jgi:hypothetical protein